MKKYVVIMMDGAGDNFRINGKTPLMKAKMPYLDKITSKGYTGTMQTLYEDLPKGSIVAQLGILGYDPYKYYPNGRASCEGLAIGIKLSKNDVAFRANFSSFEGDLLTSFNANYIKTNESSPLVDKINNLLNKNFPEFRLYHNSDFRNTLVYQNVNCLPQDFVCFQPHESFKF